MSFKRVLTDYWLSRDKLKFYLCKRDDNFQSCGEIESMHEFEIMKS